MFHWTFFTSIENAKVTSKWWMIKFYCTLSHKISNTYEMIKEFFQCSVKIPCTLSSATPYSTTYHARTASFELISQYCLSHNSQVDPISNLAIVLHKKVFFWICPYVNLIKIALCSTQSAGLAKHTWTCKRYIWETLL